MDELPKPRTSGRPVRGRGRPRQSESEVGRDKLIERARVAMNLRPRIDIQRREIAEAIGVTPALITYYFPDKWSLLEAAAHPIIMEHVAAIEDMLGAPISACEKLETLIRLYLSFNRDHGYLLDYYISSAQHLKKPENLLVLASAHQRIVDFFRDGIRSGLFKNVDAEALQSMLWCICQYLGKISADQRASLHPSTDQARLVAEHQSLIFDLFMNGVLLPASPVSGTAPHDSVKS